MVYQSPTQWLKTGIEYAHGDANISVVAVHPYSDWCVRLQLVRRVAQSA